MKKNNDDFLSYISWLFARPFVKPEILQIDFTHRCNLNCRMCNVKKYPVKESDELSKDEICDLIDQAKALGVKNFIIAGGEPLLRGDIFEICTYARERDIFPIIISNGTLLDEDFAEKMIDNFKGAISISLDGTEENHDYLRGTGSFKKTTEGIKRIINIQESRKVKNISLSIGLVITKYNYKGLIDMIHIAKDLKVDSVYFIPLLRDNTDLNDASEGNKLWLIKNEAEELRIILKDAINLSREKGVNLEIKVPEDLMVKYYLGELQGKEWLCYGGFKNIFITLCNPEKKEYFQPYVRICMEFIGNVRRERLRDIWFSKNAYNARKKIKYCATPCMQPCFPGVTPNRYKRLGTSIFHFKGKQ